MLVNWRPRARVALWQIIDYISDQNPVAAFELYNDIEQAISALPQHPYLYRKG
jgi:toxin ParE1/3/4